MQCRQSLMGESFVIITVTATLIGIIIITSSVIPVTILVFQYLRTFLHGYPTYVLYDNQPSRWLVAVLVLG